MMQMNIENTLIETLGITVVALDQDLVVLTMPVDQRTHQPAGFLLWGASVELTDTGVSIGVFLHVYSEEEIVFGIEINANHVKSKRAGIVTAKAPPVHVGKTTMVWEINITDEDNNLICISRCTIGVVKKKQA